MITSCPGCRGDPTGFEVKPAGTWKVILRMDEGEVFCKCGQYIQWVYVAQDARLALRRWVREQNE